jgi:hypothetical protein
VFLNYQLDGVTLVPEWRKPLDVLAEELVSEKVGLTRFELAASASRTQRSTRLSYSPKG